MEHLEEIFGKLAENHCFIYEKIIFHVSEIDIERCNLIPEAHIKCILSQYQEKDIVHYIKLHQKSPNFMLHIIVLAALVIRGLFSEVSLTRVPR
jgi:hypothetical protein